MAARYFLVLATLALAATNAQNFPTIVKTQPAVAAAKVQAESLVSDFDETSRLFREAVAKAVRERTAGKGASNSAPSRTTLNSAPRTASISAPGAAPRPAVLAPIPVVRALNTERRHPQESFRPTHEEEDASSFRRNNEALLHEQDSNAQYSFSTSVTDGINDSAQSREEIRDGLSLVGMYSYSDGFFKRTVHYEADDQGYRVTKEIVEPIGDGPRPNPDGQVDVSSSLAGSYSITAADIKGKFHEHEA